jgi:hypothetical protein
MSPFTILLRVVSAGGLVVIGGCAVWMWCIARREARAGRALPRRLLIAGYISLGFGAAFACRELGQSGMWPSITRSTGAQLLWIASCGAQVWAFTVLGRDERMRRDAARSRTERMDLPP